MAFKRFWGALIGSATDAQSLCGGGRSDSDIKGEGPNRIGPVVILCQSLGESALLGSVSDLDSI